MDKITEFIREELEDELFFLLDEAEERGAPDEEVSILVARIELLQGVTVH